MCYVNTHMGVGDKRKKKKEREREVEGGFLLFFFFFFFFYTDHAHAAHAAHTRPAHAASTFPTRERSRSHIYASKSGPDELPETYYTKNRNRWLYEQNWSFLSPRLWVAAHVMYRLCPRMRLCDNEMP